MAIIGGSLESRGLPGFPFVRTLIPSPCCLTARSRIKAGSHIDKYVRNVTRELIIRSKEGDGVVG